MFISCRKDRQRADPGEVGGAFPNIPDDSASLFTTYEVTEAFTIGGQAAYNGVRYGGTTVAGTANLPAYWRFDATARYRFNNRVELQMTNLLLNLTDKLYYDAIYRSVRRRSPMWHRGGRC